MVRAWQGWAPAAPDELAASLLITATGTETPVVNVFGAWQGSEGDAQGLLGELATAAGTDPVSVSIQAMTYRKTKHYLAELGDQMAVVYARLFSDRRVIELPAPDETLEGSIAANE